MNFYEPSAVTVSAIVDAKVNIFFSHILYAPSRAEKWLVIFRCGMRPSGNFLLVESRVDCFFNEAHCYLFMVAKSSGEVIYAPILMKMGFSVFRPSFTPLVNGVTLLQVNVASTRASLHYVAACYATQASFWGWCVQWSCVNTNSNWSIVLYFNLLVIYLLLLPAATLPL